MFCSRPGPLAVATNRAWSRRRDFDAADLCAVGQTAGSPDERSCGGNIAESDDPGAPEIVQPTPVCTPRRSALGRKLTQEPHYGLPPVGGHLTAGVERPREGDSSAENWTAVPVEVSS